MFISKYTALLFSIMFLVSGCSMLGSGTKGDADAGAEGAGLSESDLAAQREARFGEGGIPLAEGESVFRDVRFGYDSSNISDLARLDIEYNLEILRANPQLGIQLEGHCDERGTAEYNLALGEKRAVSVRDMLLSYGIESSRLQTISYGEEVPLEYGGSEMAYEKNRRVHFSAFRGAEQNTATY